MSDDAKQAIFLRIIVNLSCMGGSLYLLCCR